MTTRKPVTDDRARQFYVHATAWDMEDVPKSSGSANARNVLAREWDTWLAAHDAQVRRDAARSALDGLAAESMGAFNAPHSPPSPTSWAEVAGAVDWYRARRYPETEDQT